MASQHGALEMVMLDDGPEARYQKLHLLQFIELAFCEEKNAKLLLQGVG